jgi:metal-responsive CopG/Arc/MetJ family transcriptional regulator
MSSGVLPAPVTAGYMSVSLPEDLVRKIDLFVDSNDDGFRSRAEVIAQAVRQFLRDNERRTITPADVASETRTTETASR